MSKEKSKDIIHGIVRNKNLKDEKECTYIEDDIINTIEKTIKHYNEEILLIRSLMHKDCSVAHVNQSKATIIVYESIIANLIRVINSSYLRPSLHRSFSNDF